MGRPEEPASHELRQVEQVPSLLLREGHHAEGGWGKVNPETILQLHVSDFRSVF